MKKKNQTSKTTAKNTAKKSASKTKKSPTIKNATAKKGKELKTKQASKNNTPDKKTSTVKVSNAKIEKKKPSFSYTKATIIVLLIGLLGLLAYGIKNYFIVATVNGKPITRLEVIREMERQYGKDVAEGLISKKLVDQEAANKGVSVSDKEIQDELDKIKAKALKQGYDWDQALSSQGLTEETLKDQLKYQILVQKLLKDELTVTDQDVDKYIEQNKEQLGDQEITDEMRQSIKEGLESQKATTVISPWIKKLKGNADIKYFMQY